MITDNTFEKEKQEDTHSNARLWLKILLGAY